MTIDLIKMTFDILTAGQRAEKPAVTISKLRTDVLNLRLENIWLKDENHNLWKAKVERERKIESLRADVAELEHEIEELENKKEV